VTSKIKFVVWVIIMTTACEVEEEVSKMGSRNHSYLQIKLGALLLGLEQYMVLSEISLDSSSLDINTKEMRPDLALYPKLTIDFLQDEIRMQTMPLLIIEILSPCQSIDEILEKFRSYFKLGVHSCWLVLPPLQSVSVFSSPNKEQTFSQGELVDNVLNIRLAVESIFQ
jgi:Uma2 family endonuclease